MSRRLGVVAAFARALKQANKKDFAKSSSKSSSQRHTKRKKNVFTPLTSGGGGSSSGGTEEPSPPHRITHMVEAARRLEADSHKASKQLYCKAVTAGDKSLDTLERLALLHAVDGQSHEGVKYLLQARESCPATDAARRAVLTCNLAKCLVVDGQLKSARLFLEQEVELNERDPNLLGQLARVSWLQQDLEGAHAALAKLDQQRLGKSNANPKLGAYALEVEMSAALLTPERFDAALDRLSKTITTSVVVGRDLRVYAHLVAAQAHLCRGNERKARAVLRRSAALLKEQPQLDELPFTSKVLKLWQELLEALALARHGGGEPVAAVRQVYERVDETSSEPEWRFRIMCMHSLATLYALSNHSDVALPMWRSMVERLNRKGFRGRVEVDFAMGLVHRSMYIVECASSSAQVEPQQLTGIVQVAMRNEALFSSAFSSRLLADVVRLQRKENLNQILLGPEPLWLPSTLLPFV